MSPQRLQHVAILFFGDNVAHHFWSHLFRLLWYVSTPHTSITLLIFS